jgi:hypothetical protein
MSSLMNFIEYRVRSRDLLRSNRFVSSLPSRASLAILRINASILSFVSWNGYDLVRASSHVVVHSLPFTSSIDFVTHRSPFLTTFRYSCSRSVRPALKTMVSWCCYDPPLRCEPRHHLRCRSATVCVCCLNKLIIC